MDHDIVAVNRAPVLTLWASVVAESLGFDRGAALSLGKALAGLNAQTKGRSLGIYRPPEQPKGVSPRKARLGEEFWVEILSRPVPAKRTEQGIRAVVKDKPIDPDRVERYLQEKFGEELQAARSAMEHLAGAIKPEELAVKAYSLYERFRPAVPAGIKGWGAKGDLDLKLIRSLAKRA